MDWLGIDLYVHVTTVTSVTWLQGPRWTTSANANANSITTAAQSQPSVLMSNSCRRFPLNSFITTASVQFLNQQRWSIYNATCSVERSLGWTLPFRPLLPGQSELLSGAQVHREHPSVMKGVESWCCDDGNLVSVNTVTARCSVRCFWALLQFPVHHESEAAAGSADTKLYKKNSMNCSYRELNVGPRLSQRWRVSYGADCL